MLLWEFGFIHKANLRLRIRKVFILPFGLPKMSVNINNNTMKHRITIKIIVFSALCLGIGQFAASNMANASQNQDATRQTTTYRHQRQGGASVVAARARANASMRDLHSRQRDQHSSDRTRHGSGSSRQTQARDQRNQDRDQRNQDRDRQNQAREAH